MLLSSVHLPNIVLSGRKNTKRISMKFTGRDYYHERIKWLHFGRNCNRNKGAEKIRIDVNRFCGDVKQVLTPSE